MSFKKIIKKSLSRKILIVTGAMIIIFFIFVVENNIQPTPKSLAEERLRWARILEEEGAPSAYWGFITDYQDEPFGIQHGMMHIFGELLYERLGVSGITQCDPSFSFGCYHGFFSVAITSEGTSVVSFFDEACEGAEVSPAACRHGIGHGIMEYLGPQKLEEALEMCSETTWSGPIGGCLSGVFMEFNVPLVVDEFGEYVVVSRPLDPKNPYAPCVSLDEMYQQSCYHELPHWWTIVYEKDYVKIGELCRDIGDSTFRSNCYVGVGNIVAPTTDYHVEDTIAICKKMLDTEGESLCLLSSAQAFSWSEKGETSAHKLCSNIQPVNNMTCPQ